MQMREKRTDVKLLELKSSLGEINTHVQYQQVDCQLFYWKKIAFE